MTIIIKVKKLTFYQIEPYGFAEIKNNRVINRCAIIFSTNFANTLFVYSWIFIVKK
jgi:hypothetical protein